VLEGRNTEAAALLADADAEAARLAAAGAVAAEAARLAAAGAADDEDIEKLEVFCKMLITGKIDNKLPNKIKRRIIQIRSSNIQKTIIAGYSRTIGGGNNDIKHIDNILSLLSQLWKCLLNPSKKSNSIKSENNDYQKINKSFSEYTLEQYLNKDFMSGNIKNYEDFIPITRKEFYKKITIKQEEKGEVQGEVQEEVYKSPVFAYFSLMWKLYQLKNNETFSIQDLINKKADKISKPAQETQAKGVVNKNKLYSDTILNFDEYHMNKSTTNFNGNTIAASLKKIKPNNGIK